MKKLITVFFVALLLIGTTNLSAAGNKGRMEVGGSLGLSVPTGDFADAAGIGFGFEATFAYYVAQFVALNAFLGYTTWGEEFQGLTMSNVPLLVGIHYYIAMTNMQFILGLRLGLHMMSSHYDNGLYSGSNSETNFGLTPLVGLRFPLTSQLALLAILQYNMIFADSNLFHLMFNFTLRYRLPK